MDEETVGVLGRHQPIWYLASKRVVHFFFLKSMDPAGDVLFFYHLYWNNFLLSMEQNLVFICNKLFVTLEPRK